MTKRHLFFEGRRFYLRALISRAIGLGASAREGKLFAVRGDTLHVQHAEIPSRNSGATSICARRRIPIEAEQAVLGGLMLDRAAWDNVGDVVTAEDFFRPDHALIFESIASLAAEAKPCDPVTVSEHLQRLGKLNDAGGLAYLGTLTRDTPGAANARAYAEIVKERALLRELVTAGGEIAGSVWSEEGEVGARTRGDRRSGAFSRSPKAARAARDTSARKQALPALIDQIDDLYNNPNKPRGLPTGFIDFDRLTGGLRGGDLLIIAGRPSMGKTTLAINMAEHAASKQGRTRVGRHLFAGNARRSDAHAHVVVGGQRAPRQHPQRQALRRRLAAHHRRDQTAPGREDIHRRHAGAHADGIACARTAHQARARSRSHRRGLPAAHVGAGHEGESRHRDLRRSPVASRRWRKSCIARSSRCRS